MGKVPESSLVRRPLLSLRPNKLKLPKPPPKKLVLLPLAEPAIEPEPEPQNIYRHMPPIEFALATKHRYEVKRLVGYSHAEALKETAQENTVSPKTLERHWRLLDLPPDLRPQVNRKSLPRSIAPSTSGLRNIGRDRGTAEAGCNRGSGAALCRCDSLRAASGDGKRSQRDCQHD